MVTRIPRDRFQGGIRNAAIGPMGAGTGHRNRIGLFSIDSRDTPRSLCMKSSPQPAGRSWANGARGAIGQHRDRGFPGLPRRSPWWPGLSSSTLDGTDLPRYLAPCARQRRLLARPVVSNSVVRRCQTIWQFTGQVLRSSRGDCALSSERFGCSRRASQVSPGRRVSQFLGSETFSIIGRHVLSLLVSGLSRVPMTTLGGDPQGCSSKFPTLWRG